MSTKADSEKKIERSSEDSTWTIYRRWLREYRQNFRTSNERLPDDERHAAKLYELMLELYRFFFATSITLFSAYIALVAFVLKPEEGTTIGVYLAVLCLIVGLMLTFIYWNGFFAAVHFMNALKAVSATAGYFMVPSGKVFVRLVGACGVALALICVVLMIHLLNKI